MEGRLNSEEASVWNAQSATAKYGERHPVDSVFVFLFRWGAAAPMKGSFVIFFFFLKIATFIIHVKEITVKFNLGEATAPV